MIESVGIMSEIYELEQIRQRISERYLSDPNIRINVSLRQPRLHLRDVPVKITGVYRHIFQVEEDLVREAEAPCAAIRGCADARY